MPDFLKMYRKSTKRSIPDEENLDKRQKSIHADEYRIKGRPVQRNEKPDGTLVDLIAIEYFSCFIDDIVFVFNDIFDNEFFNRTNISFHISIIWHQIRCYGQDNRIFLYFSK